MKSPSGLSHQSNGVAADRLEQWHHSGPSLITPEEIEKQAHHRLILSALVSVTFAVMPGLAVAAPADQILAATQRVYTREVLDRGGWINPWVAGAHCSAGQPLLAVRPGEGVTGVAQRPAPTVVAAWAPTAAH